ncbi:MAG: ABC transporter transmembrane domain-containing protein, partial [Chthoniobacterales bacterium]
MNKSLSDSIYLLRGYNCLLKPYRRQYVIVLLGIVTQIVFYTFYPLIFKNVFDVVIPSRQMELLYLVAAEVLVLLVVCGVGAYFQTKYMAKTGALVMRDLRAGMVTKLNLLPFSFYSNLDTVDLLSRFSSDMDRVENSLTRALPTLLENVLITLGCIITILFIDWRLGLAAAFLLPIGFVGNIVLGPKEDTLNSESRRQKNHMLSSVEDVINAWLLIRVFNDDNHMKGRFDFSSTTYAKTASNYSYYLNLMPIVSEFVV